MAVAERLYAKALFEAAEDSGRVDAVQRDLGEFADAVEASPELSAFLANPQVDPAAKVGVLGELSEGCRRARPQLPPPDRGEGAGRADPRDPRRVPGARRPRAGTRRGRADDRLRAVRRRGCRDRRPDRAILRPQGRGDPQSRPRAGRRHDPAGRFAARRRQRARPPGAPPPRTRHPVTKEQT